MFLHLFNDHRSLLPEVSAAPMKTAFTSGEVQVAMKQLQNNKNVGRYNIKVRNFKCGT